MNGLSRTATHTLLALFVLASTAFAGDLGRDIDAAVRAANLSGAQVSISVRDADTGTQLVSVQPSLPMIPASNMKLFTSGAALHVLGPTFEFETRLVHDGDRFIVVGDGDPAFGDPELLSQMHVGDQVGIDVETFLDFWVQGAVDSGVTRIGQVLADDRIFDREFVHPSWPLDQLNRSYCAEIAGLSFYLNVLQFYPEPSNGQRPIVSIFQPQAPWLTPTNRATGRKGERDTVWIARKQNTNELTVFGNVSRRHKEPVAVTVHDVPEYFAHLLTHRLRRAGIKVGGHGRVAPDDPQAEGDLIGPLITTPLITVLTRCNRYSSNLYAEALLKRIGHEMTGQPGSWANGTAIVRSVIYERVRDPALTDGIVIADGSGLSRNNRITTECMTAWLCSFHRDPQLGDLFIDSLAVAGAGGTLRKRFRNAQLHGAVVQAKSGYINQVSCLSGFVTAQDGRRYAFSVLVNGVRGGTAPAKQLQEQVVAAIAKQLAVHEVVVGQER
jgi:D-alanyl-D-alanine carboxypeptidase/D-alanyl-D-alanine-endopeptidase (penicillin-binding protein 4)